MDSAWSSIWVPRGELDERGRYPLDQHDLAFHHLPVLDQTWQHMDIPEFDNDAAFLMWAYQDMLRVGGAEFGAALGLIANAGITPMVFHCAAGKDRTGILAALTRRVQWQP